MPNLFSRLLACGCCGANYVMIRDSRCGCSAINIAPQFLEGIDPLGLRVASREAPRVNDLIARYLAEHTPHLAPPALQITTRSCTNWSRPTVADGW